MIMNYILSALIFVLCGVIVHRDYTAWKQAYSSEKSRHEERQEWYTERQEWNDERQQLLDRIQAPSFDHLKQAEIRLVKAQKEEPAVKYELV